MCACVLRIRDQRWLAKVGYESSSPRSPHMQSFYITSLVKGQGKQAFIGVLALLRTGQIMEETRHYPAATDLDVSWSFVLPFFFTCNASVQILIFLICAARLMPVYHPTLCVAITITFPRRGRRSGKEDLHHRLGVSSVPRAAVCLNSG